MKRRSFIRGLLAASAVALSPVLFNRTKLELAGVDEETVREALKSATSDAMNEAAHEAMRGTLTVTLKKIGKNGHEEVIKQTSMTNVLADQGMNRTARVEGPCNITEIGCTGPLEGRLYSRVQFEDPIVVQVDEVIESVWEYRLNPQRAAS